MVDGLDQVLSNLLAFPERVERAAVLAGEALAPAATDTLQSDAAWTDQTGDARASLRVSVGVDAQGPLLAFAGGTQGLAEAYSAYLQVNWGGRFANLYPAAVAWAPRWAQATTELFGR